MVPLAQSQDVRETLTAILPVDIDALQQEQEEVGDHYARWFFLAFRSQWEELLVLLVLHMEYSIMKLYINSCSLVLFCFFQRMVVLFCCWRSTTFQTKLFKYF